jgi:triacylglycerol lipase
MKKILLLLIVISAFLVIFPVFSASEKACAASGRQCPIILVNPWLLSYDRGGVFGLRIWGGNKCDLQEELIAAGYPTSIAALGPFSSTWDRTCELYAEIMGGTVDYGLAHSRKYGHTRYGRTYSALYPEWGTPDPLTGKPRKVHLIGYCFGGLTTRLLIQLLEKGRAEEQAATPPNQLSPLFAGNHSWVLSCTTIVTPHDGTSLLDQTILNGIANSTALQFLVDVIDPYINDGFYDARLDQWGIYQYMDESFNDFIKRLGKDPSWKNTHDFSNYDITPLGVYDFNSWVKAQPDVYYFSLAADATYTAKDGHRLPLTSMFPLCYNWSRYMGSHVRSTPPFPVTKAWWPNDGTVNTISQNGPKVGSRDKIVNFTGIPQVGKWNFLGTLKGIDHADVVGITLGWYPTYDPLPWFLNHAALLSSLPQ